MNHAARSCRHRVGPPWKDEHPAIAPCVKATACQNLGPVYSMISSRLREAQALTPTGPRAELVQHLGRSAGCNAVQCKVGYAHRPEPGVKPRCMHKQRSSATRCKSSQNDTKLVPSQDQCSQCIPLCSKDSGCQRRRQIEGCRRSLRGRVPELVHLTHSRVLYLSVELRRLGFDTSHIQPRW